MPQDYLQLGKQIQIIYYHRITKILIVKTRKLINSPVYGVCSKLERVNIENCVQNKDRLKKDDY